MKENGQILILTGWRGTGKTSLCAKLIAAARAARWQVGGVLCPARFENGSKTGILVKDLRSGEERVLATRATENDQGLRTRRWLFDPAQFTWGSRIFELALPCDLFVVDELGPLEFERGEGWLTALTALDSKRFRLALVIIRPELLETAQARWPQAKIVEVKQVGEIEALANHLRQQYF
jgi:nucleoside-triphosphatase THEP1